MREEPQLSEMHTVRTTIRPHEEITVDDAEYTDLKAMGLIVGGTEQEEIAAALAQAEADRAAAAAAAGDSSGSAPGAETPGESGGSRTAAKSAAQKKGS